MSHTSIYRFILALLVALSVATASARAQGIETLVGGWMYLAFGTCGIFGCLNGPRLCAVVNSSDGISWCYER